MSFEISQNFFFSFPFLKFINFKITTNSLIYSLVEQFLETHFHKNNYRVRGILLEREREKNLPKISCLYSPYLRWEGYIIWATIAIWTQLMQNKFWCSSTLICISYSLTRCIFFLLIFQLPIRFLLNNSILLKLTSIFSSNLISIIFSWYLSYIKTNNCKFSIKVNLKHWMKIILKFDWF